MEDLLKFNKKWWDSVTTTHLNSDLYDYPSFKKGKTSLQKTELEELGNVKGKTMLHLMCHFGMDALSWARQGAVVTGVDVSSESIKLAKKLSKENNIPANFIASDVYELPKILDEKFDIVFLSYGVLQWLSDIKKFGKIVSHYLKEGGTFYIVEVHPYTTMLSYDFKLEYKYFYKGPYEDDSEGSYTDWNDTSVGGGVTYEWHYTFADVINSLIHAGLTIEYIHEFPYTMYDQFPGFMEKNKKGQYVLKNKKIQVPLLFSLKASK